MCFFTGIQSKNGEAFHIHIFLYLDPAIGIRSYEPNPVVEKLGSVCIVVGVTKINNSIFGHIL